MTLKSKAFDVTQNFVIALDGPAASGKGTIGQMLAEKFTLIYFQSSLVYRNLAFNCIKQRIDIEDIKTIISLSKSLEINENIDLEDEYIGNIASQIAAIAEVRNNLNKYLINLISSTPRIIMEGRDIGTVIAPKADLKIFITASAELRAQRRYNQLQKKGKACILTEILHQIKLRDKRDEERKTGPLLPAIDALVIDTSGLTPGEITERITKFIFSGLESLQKSSLRGDS
ncbi:(d)CMP kinase [Rickettsia endosymbiont of Halotydeus destructor]|uniref:(d)CMP kinase n=1 Tax=Rickettsia endosymbiont of Halotydeus destructor TaxID=2996754 RepID=UPI003BAF8A3B